MFKQFDNSLKGNSTGLEKIITWLKAEFEQNKQEDSVKALNQSQDGTQKDMKSKILALYTAEVEEVEVEPQPSH